MNTFTKTDVFLSVFVQKRSSINGALVEYASSASSISMVEALGCTWT